MVCIALLLSESGFPCNQVIIGGLKPLVLGRIAGRVVGSARIDLMGESHNAERHSIAVSDATLSIKIRTDLEFFREGEVKPSPGQKPSDGNLKKWKCGDEMAQTITDRAGNFALSALKSGKYCLEITGPKSRAAGENQMHHEFLVDLAQPAPNPLLVTDISPLWADCSGGGSLKLKSPD